MNDINSDSDLIDTPNWWKRIWAGVGDVLSMIINAVANQSFLRTSFTRQAVIDLCELIDYDLSSVSTSSGTLIFYLDGSTAFPLVVAKADLAAQNEGSVTVAQRRFEGRASASITAVNETFTVSAGDDWLIVARVYLTGEKVRFTTTNTLPAPLAINTDYYVIYVDDTHIRLATSLSDAYAGTYINITTTGVGVHTIHLYSSQVTAYQQESLSNSIIIGESDGVTTWQEFELPDLKILSDTIELTINSDSWTLVTTFVNSSSTDKHFKLIYLENGKAKIGFGNGVYGAIPGAFDIFADYSYGGGLNSNISTLDKINIYAGSDSNVEGVSNATTFTGGDDEENIESAKKLGPLLLKARDRAVTTEDFEALSESFSGVSQAKANKNVYGLLSVQIVIVPSGGGAPSASLKSSLDTYLTERTLLSDPDGDSAINVVVDDPTYVTANVTSAMKMLSGYDFADVLPFYRLCVRLLFSEYTKELVGLYNSSGIEAAVVAINTKWSDTFTSNDYAQIQTFLTEMDERNLIPEFGQTYQDTETLGFINMFVEGCDYLTWALPVFPIALDDDEISTDGTTTLTEIA
jgi:hypothetical protein